MAVTRDDQGIGERPTRDMDRAMALRSGKRYGWRRFLSGSHFLLSVLLAFSFVLLLNVLASYLDVSWRVPGRPAELSPRTLELLSNARGHVNVIVLVPRTHVAFEPLRLLLTLLKDATSSMENTSLDLFFVDPRRDLAQATRLSRQYGVAGHAVVFSGQDRHEILPVEDVFDGTRSSGKIGTKTKVSGRFIGEQVCAAALARLARSEEPTVYTLQGHDERDFGNYDPLVGYSDLAREIRREGYRLQPLLLANTGEVPSDGDILIVAGPKRPPTEEESAQLEAFLAKGGRLLWLLDRLDFLPNGWENLLACLSLRQAQATVVGAPKLAGQALVVDRFGDHPITRDLRGTAVYFVRPQVLLPLVPNDLPIMEHPRATAIVSASPQSSVLLDTYRLAETNRMVSEKSPLRNLEEMDSYPVVVAVEKGAASGDDLGLRPMRAVVFGDSHFAVNALLAGGRTGNRDLVLNALNWLSEAGLPTAASAPLDSNAIQLGLSRRKQVRFLLRIVVMWPAVFLLAGVLCMAVRRRG